MNQYILINRIKVQNANAIAGFTWGFPAITNFLGFTHNLTRKLFDSNVYKDISLAGCAVIAHDHHVHVYGKYDAEFTQYRNPPYLHSHDKAAPPPIVEEGKMNMTISLLIGCTGNVGNRTNDFKEWIMRNCFLQRLAGGTIFEIGSVEVILSIEENVRLIKRKLLPGFILMDRSGYLESHYKKLCVQNPDTELIDAWMDFSSLKRKARPKSDLIHKHLSKLHDANPDDQLVAAYLLEWQDHLKKQYKREHIPDILYQYFSGLELTQSNKSLVEQWNNYCGPNEKTDADWEYVPKPESGYLVPIMTGYKAISPVYQNAEVKNTRDNETPICFVESVHSVGEWKSVHRLKTVQDLSACLWNYHYEENWYLCKQKQTYHREPNMPANPSDTAEYPFY